MRALGGVQGIGALERSGRRTAGAADRKKSVAGSGRWAWPMPMRQAPTLVGEGGGG